MLTQLHVSIGISLTCGKRFHEHIISLGWEFWDRTTTFTPTFVIEVLAPSMESERSCISLWVVEVTIFASVATSFRLDFETVPTAWYFFFYFHFISALHNQLLALSGALYFWRRSAILSMPLILYLR